MAKILRIEVDFPVGIDLADEDCRDLDALLTRICARYRAANPDRVMWPFGCGAKMLVNPLKLSDDEPIPFDDSVYAVKVAERENYDWPCARCGLKQIDHGGGPFIDAKAGDCAYEPAPAPENMT